MTSHHRTAISKKSRIAEEKALIDDSYLAENLFEIAQVIVLILDTNGKIVRFNPYMEELSGYRLAEVQGKDWFTTFLPERNRERIMKIFLKAADNIQTSGNVNAIVTRDGRERTIAWYDKTLKNPDGKVVGLLCIGLDITERLSTERVSQQAQEALRESDERYHSLVESSDDPIYLVGRNLKYLFANEKLLSRLGKSLAEVAGQDYSQFHSPEATQEFSAKVEQVYKNRRPVSYKHQSHRDGREFIRTLSPVIDPETKIITAVTVIAKDITERKDAEEKIKISEEFFREVTENSSDIILIVDKMGTITYISPPVERFLGYRPEELIGESGFKYIHPADIPRALADFSKAILTKDTAIPNSFRVLHKDGSVRTFEGLGKNLLNHPAIAGFIMNGHDITERKQIENALRESEEKFRSLVESSEDPVYLVDIDLKYLHVNRRLLSRYGKSLNEVVGKRYSDFHSPERTEEFSKRIAEVIESGKPKIYEHLSQRDDRFFLRTLSPVINPKTGEVSAVTVFSKDITERKKAEEKLRESEEKYRNVVERANDGIIIIQDSIIQYANLRVAEIWGGSVEEIIGTRFMEYIDPGESPKLVERYRQRMVGESVPSIYETVQRRKNGEMAYVEVNAGVIKYLGKPADLLIIRNITERKRAEEALRESEERYRSLVESSADPIYLIDRNLKYLFANNKFLSRLGKSLNEVVGQDYFQFHPDSVGTKEFSAMIEKVFKSGKPVSYEHKSHRDGREFIRTLSPIKDPKTKKITTITVISKDITERKQAEEKLRESEEKFRNIFDNSAVGKSITHFDGLMNPNKALCNMFGYTKEELSHGKWQDITYADDIELSNRYLEKLKSGEEKYVRFVKRYVRKDGSIMWADANVMLQRSGDGMPLFFITEIVDITERKQAEEEITKLAKFPAEDPEPVMRLNNDGTILNANKACDSLLIDWGWKRGKKVPKCWRDLLGDVLEKRTTRIIEMQSAEKVFSFFFVPIAEAKYVNLYGREITELKSTENALLHSEYMLRRLREHTEEIVEEERHRISQIIHDDLGQRLTGLMMDLESIKWELAKHVKIPSSYVIAKIDDMNVSIQTLVDRVRKISTEVRPAVLDDLGLSTAIRWKIREFTEHSNVPCVFKSVPKDIALNPRQNITFFRIFTEALTNITRHAEASNVHIRLTQTPQSVMLKICDDGKGMSDQTIVSSESLGIYSMRERAQSIGAQFSIKSEPGKGTAITVVLSGAEN